MTDVEAPNRPSFRDFHAAGKTAIRSTLEGIALAIFQMIVLAKFDKTSVLGTVISLLVAIVWALCRYIGSGLRIIIKFIDDRAAYNTPIRVARRRKIQATKAGKNAFQAERSLRKRQSELASQILSMKTDIAGGEMAMQFIANAIEHLPDEVGRMYGTTDTIYSFEPLNQARLRTAAWHDREGFVEPPIGQTYAEPFSGEPPADAFAVRTLSISGTVKPVDEVHDSQNKRLNQHRSIWHYLHTCQRELPKAIRRMEERLHAAQGELQSLERRPRLTIADIAED